MADRFEALFVDASTNSRLSGWLRYRVSIGTTDVNINNPQIRDIRVKFGRSREKVRLFAGENLEIYTSAALTGVGETRAYRFVVPPVEHRYLVISFFQPLSLGMYVTRVPTVEITQTDVAPF